MHASSVRLVVGGVDSDIPVNTLTYALLDLPSNGVLSGFNSVSGEVAYTPNLNYNSHINSN